MLSGGLANANVLVDGRVLRIYRRDPRALPLETALLQLPWEFAYAGSRLSDIGQLLRWTPPEAFVRAFARAYVEAGGALPADFRKWARLFDLVNLVGLVANRPTSLPSRESAT